MAIVKRGNKFNIIKGTGRVSFICCSSKESVSCFQNKIIGKKQVRGKRVAASPPAGVLHGADMGLWPGDVTLGAARLGLLAGER